MTDYWFAPLEALDPRRRQNQDDRLRILFTLRRPPPSIPVHDPGVLTTVHDLIGHLSGLAPADLNNILLGSHATLEAQLHLPMHANQVNSITGGTNTDYEILDRTLKPGGTSIAFPASLFNDPNGFIHFRGCNAGRFRPLMLKMKQAFGDVHHVTAPKHFHGITTRVNPDLTGVGVFEYMSYAFRATSKTPFQTRSQLINALVNKGYKLVDGTVIDAARYAAFMRRMTGAGAQQVPNTYQLGRTLAENTVALRIPTELHVETNQVDQIAFFDPAVFPTPGNEAAAFADNVRASPYLQPGYPSDKPSDEYAFPFYERLDLASASEYYDAHTWALTPDAANNQIRGVGTRVDYELRVPITDPDTNTLVYNFFPVVGSPDPVVTLLRESDSFYFGNTSLPP